MKAHRVSASNVHAFLDCAVPFRLDVALVPDPPGPKANDGKALHRAFELQIKDPEMAPDLRAICASFDADHDRVLSLWMPLLDWLDRQPETKHWAAEMKMLWNARTDTTRVVPNEQSDDDRAPFEVPAIADAIVHDSANHVTLYDVKTGKPQYAKPHQLAVCAVAASRHYDVTNVTGVFLFVDPKGVHEECHDFDEEAISRWAAQVEANLLYLPESTPEPGESCRFCRVKECQPGEALRKRMKWAQR